MCPLSNSIVKAFKLNHNIREYTEKGFSFEFNNPQLPCFSITLLLVSYFNKPAESNGVVPAVLVDVVVQDGWVRGDSCRHDRSFSSAHHHVFANKLQHRQVLSEFTVTKVSKSFVHVHQSKYFKCSCTMLLFWTSDYVCPSISKFMVDLSTFACSLVCMQ